MNKLKYNYARPVHMRVEQVLIEHGIRDIPRFRKRDEWGPACVGCDAEEFRIDGFCSCECRDRHELGADIREALNDPFRQPGTSNHNWGIGAFSGYRTQKEQDAIRRHHEPEGEQ